MTAAIGFRRLGIAVGAVLLGGFAVLAAVPFLIPADNVREAVAAEVHGVTGLDLSLRGDVAVSLFPSGSVSFSDVTLGDDAETALAADRLVARLRFFPLLIGRIEISEVNLERPRITIDLPSDGRSNWSGLITQLAKALGPNGKGTDQSSSFSEIQVTDGTIILRDGQRGESEIVRDVNMALAWPSISRSFAATGRFVWRDEPVDASLVLTDFAAALAGERSGIKLRLIGAPLKVAFDGAASVLPSLKIDGTLAADAASLRDTLRWAGQRPITGPGLGRFALKAKTSVNNGTIALTGVNLELDGNSAEGVLTFATTGRQTLQGTLAATDLDLTPYLSTVRLMTADEREWSRMPIALDGLNGFDLDLRLSARAITLARAKLGRTAVAANLRAGKLTVTIGESLAFGGVVRGSMSFGTAEAGAEMKSQLQFSDVDLETSLNELFNFRRIEGRGNMTVAVEAAGSSVLALARTMNGTADLLGRQGALVGLNVETLLRRLERRPLSGSGDFRNGRTPFDRLTVALKITHGTASVEDVRLEGSKVRLGLAGTASIPARDFDLRGVAALVTSNTSESTPQFELPFVVHGPWDDPIMLPDTQSLIMRSPAASPLFDAVKGRSTRDSVRSAIERLTGATPSPAPAEPARPLLSD